MRKLLLFLIIGTFWLIVGSTVCSAEEANLDSITVNVDFQDTDLRRALLFISVDTGLSIIPDADVTGTVTARFIDQPVLEVLERILEVNDCEYKLVGNIIQVIRIPVVSKILPLKFALAFEVAASVESLVLLSPKGTLEVDEEANSLLISDKRPYLEEIVSFIQELDVPEKQLRSKTFSPQFLKVERLASLIKDQLTDRGKIDIDPSTNSLLITETSFHLTRITSLVESLDTFQPERKVFPLKFALASDMERLIKGYLSPEGTLEVDEERNELTIRDTSYYLEKVGSVLADLDRAEKQIRKESFPIKYARIEDLALLLKENLSPEGTLELDEERGLISIEDTSYHLFELGRLIEQQDSFIPKKKTYRVRFASLKLAEEKAKELLSDKGRIVETPEPRDYVELVVSDVEKNLERIGEEIRKIDKLEIWERKREYTLECYYTPEEVQHRLENVLTKTRDFEGKIIRLPKARYTATQAQEEEEFILIPQEEGPIERETVSERVLERQLSRFEGDELLSREKAETEGNVIEVRDLERNIANIEKLIEEMNGKDAREEPITRTFYIKEGSLERMAVAMANILGINPDDIEGLEPEGEWMEMRVSSLEIDLGTMGPE
ncbi:MAG: secretin N-terminal domain-containing protein [Candidatus Aerophobetes bacterium]